MAAQREWQALSWLKSSLVLCSFTGAQPYARALSLCRERQTDCFSGQWSPLFSVKWLAILFMWRLLVTWEDRQWCALPKASAAGAASCPGSLGLKPASSCSTQCLQLQQHLLGVSQASMLWRLWEARVRSPLNVPSAQAGWQSHPSTMSPGGGRISP